MIKHINSQTLSCGSEDQGRTVHCNDAILASKMKQAAKILNLKPRLINGRPLYSAIDVEGHKGTVCLFF